MNERNSRGATSFEQCIFSSIMNHECQESIGILRRLVSAGAQLQPCSGPLVNILLMLNCSSVSSSVM